MVTLFFGVAINVNGPVLPAKVSKTRALIRHSSVKNNEINCAKSILELKKDHDFPYEKIMVFFRVEQYVGAKTARSSGST